MSRNILIGVCCFFLFKSVKSQREITVPLSKTKGSFPFFSRRSFGTFQEKFDGFKLDTSSYSIYGVWKFHFDQMQSAYNSFLKSGRRDSNFIRRQEIDKWNVSKLKTEPYDNSVNVFVGIDKTGRYNIILDQNNNNDFTDDQKYVYQNHKPPHDSLNYIESTFPVVNIRVNIWEGQKMVERHLLSKFILKEYFGSANIKFGNPRADTLLIVAEVQEHFVGRFILHGKPLNIYVHEGFLSARLNNLTGIKFYVTSADDKITKPVKDYSLYTINDTIPILNDLYKIQSLDPLGKNLTLKYCGVGKGLGIDSGFYAKPIKGEDLSTGQIVNYNDLKGSYLLIDFWGTWCSPCKEILPNLRTLNEKYKNRGLRIVSIAFDENKELVKKEISSENMNWTNFWDPSTSSSPRNTITNLYKVENFPTSILVDPKGKIIFREFGIPGFNKLEYALKRIFKF